MIMVNRSCVAVRLGTWEREREGEREREREDEDTVSHLNTLVSFLMSSN